MHEESAMFYSEFGPVISAERELAAFVRAVKELFGIEQARLAMADWMEELEATDCPSGEAAPMWRRITIAAAARLARRVSKRAMGKTNS